MTQMHIAEILAAEATTVSFEFFPPKTAADSQGLYENIAHLETLQPSFVSAKPFDAESARWCAAQRNIF